MQKLLKHSELDQRVFDHFFSAIALLEMLSVDEIEHVAKSLTAACADDEAASVLANAMANIIREYYY